MRIKSIKSVEKEKTYDLNIKDNHNYFVTESKLLVHNSGKDSTKVDRSGAYMARYIAKNIVASGITDECSVQLAYAIGVAEPVGLYIDAKGLTDEQSTSLTEQVREQLDLTPRGIINLFNLRDPKFFETSQHGHFGHPHFAWEQVNLTFSI